jgi:replicative DNA helicase
VKQEAQLERPLPNNLEAERSVLGAILLDNAALSGARELLTPEDFFLNQHRHVFYEMAELHDKGEAIDLVTLTEKLHSQGELEAAGGSPYISALADGMPKVSNIVHYAKIVKEKALLRALVHTTHNIQQHALDGEGTAAEILDGARASLTALIHTQPRGGLVAVKDVVRNNVERIEKIFTEGRNVTGLASGYSELDRALAGLQPGELVILAARPSQGKSSLALNITENVAVRNNIPVAFFSLEMSSESLLFRLLASVGHIDAHKFRTGHISKDDYRRITASLGTIAMAPVWIDDSSSSTIAEIAARAERAKTEHGLGLVIVDYLQLIASRSGRNRQEEVSAVSRGLKALAKDLQVPVLALSQLTRAPDREERAPLLSDLRESGAIEQDADVVLFIHRPNLNKDVTMEEREMADVIIAKQRNGPTDIIRFVFRSNLTRFEERAPDMFGAPE